MPLASIRQYLASKVEQFAATCTPEFLRNSRREIESEQNNEIRQAFLDYQVSARRCVTQTEFSHIYRDLRRRVNEANQKQRVSEIR